MTYLMEILLSLSLPDLVFSKGDYNLNLKSFWRKYVFMDKYMKKVLLRQHVSNNAFKNL